MAEIIDIDTDKMNSYANRLGNVNSILSNLDVRWNTLCRQVGSPFFGGAIASGAISGYGWIIRQCQNYLLETARDFACTESDIAGYSEEAHYSAHNGISQIGKIVFENKVRKNKLNTLFGEYLCKTWNDYLSIIKDNKLSSADKLYETVSWLNDIQENILDSQEYLDSLPDINVDLPAPLQEGLKCINYLNIGTNVVYGVKSLFEGIGGRDNEKLSDSADKLIEAVTGIVEEANSKLINASPFAGIVINFGGNMVSNWIESIQKETKTSEVYLNTFGGALIDTFQDTVCNDAVLFPLYYPTRILTSFVGYDLQAEYEKVSDKKGYAAVTDSIGQLHSLIKENLSWENWKSGVKLMFGMK